MDNIYVRLQQRIISPLTVTLMAFSGTSAWCSHMTLQGDHGIQRALLPFKNAAVHISGVLLLSPFTHSRPDGNAQAPCKVHAM